MCIEELLAKEKCIPNPFIAEDFVLLNSSQTKYSFCNSTQNYTKIDKTICDKKCIKDCSQTYYTMSLNNKYYLTKSDSKIKIKFKSSQDFRYECKVKIDFVTYLSNIGGLIALWFGLSFIDMSSFIKFIIVILKNKLSRLNLQKLIEFFGEYYLKFKISSFFECLKGILVFIEKHDLRTFLILLSIPIFLNQIYELVDSYLQFSTEVSVEIISYRDSDNNIRYNQLPAITVCNDHIFEELLFNENIRPDILGTINDPVVQFRYNYQESEIAKDTYNSNDPFIRNVSNYYKYEYGYFKKWLDEFDQFRPLIDVDNQEQFMQNSNLLSNKHLSGFNFTITEFNLYERIGCFINSDLIIFNDTIINSKIRSTRYCYLFKKIVRSLSSFGKCMTYLYRMNDLKIFIKLNQYFAFFVDPRHDYYENKFLAINRRFIIHSQDLLPILTDSDLSITDRTTVAKKGFSIKLTKFQFERLPKPYDTNCQMYGNSTRFQCLNECYFDGYMRSHIKCIPNSESLYTFEINVENENRSKIFCESDDENSIKYLNINLREKCFDKCLVSCDEIYFSTDYEEIQSFDNVESGPMYMLILKDIYYRKIKHSPKMTFFILLISIANIWSLWHGINFQQIFDIILRFSKFMEFLELLFSFGKKIIICLKLGKIISFLIEFEKKVKNKINIQVISI